MLHNMLQIPCAMTVWTVSNHCAGFPVKVARFYGLFPVKVLEVTEYRYIICPGNLLQDKLLSLKQTGIFKVCNSLSS